MFAKMLQLILRLEMWLLVKTRSTVELQLEDYINDLCRGQDKSLKYVLKNVSKNTLWALDSNTSKDIAAKYSRFRLFGYEARLTRFNQVKFDIDVANKAYRKLKDTVFRAVGVQPMTAPVGLIYKMINIASEQESFEFGTMQRKQLKVVSATVEARFQKLRAKLTMECMQDIRVTHDIDIEKEIITVISEEVADAVTLELLETIERIAVSRDSCDLGSKENLVASVYKMSNAIATTSDRGIGNVLLVTDQLVYKTLSDVPALADFEIRLVPSYSQEAKIYVAYKGKGGEVDSGLFYCPYVLVMKNDLVDPESFQPCQVYGTRYGLYAWEESGKYFGVITVNKAT